MSLLKTRALVLRRFPLGESDAVFSLFGQKTGRIRAVARRIMKPTNPWHGLLEPFHFIQVHLFRKPGNDLFRITEADSIRRYEDILKNLDALGAGFEILEIMEKLTPYNEPDPPLFGEVIQALEELNSAHDSLQVAFRAMVFKLRFVQHAGLQFEINRCVVCGKPRNARAAMYDVAAGGVVCSACRKPDIPALYLSAASLAVIQAVFEGKIFRNIPRDALERFLSETTSVMEAFFQYHFDYSPKAQGIFQRQ